MDQASIDDLPEEVFEFILSLISPYKDLHDCMQVSKKWRRCVQNVARTKQRNFYRAICSFDVHWKTITPVDMAPSITRRYSHTAVIHNNSMYVFGGCTCAMTTFNDLWRLDLSTRQWIRPLAMGTYPSPKACSSLVKYKETLILFGGWAYPPSYPLYQNWHLFDELHVYDIPANRWTCITMGAHSPPPMAGHSVCIVKNTMVVFGGLQKNQTQVHCEKSNDVWLLDLEEWTWSKPRIEEDPKPNGRFGQTQVLLDDDNILILGGSGGPLFYYSDAWILNMSGPIWKWIKVNIEGKSNEPSNIWSNPGCRVGDKIVVLNRIRPNETNSVVYYPKTAWASSRNQPEDGRLSRIDLANRQNDKDDNVNGKRGTLRNPKPQQQQQKEPAELEDLEQVKVPIQKPAIPAMAAFNSPNVNPQRHQEERNERRLQKLAEIRAKFTGAKRERKTHYLGLYALDISEILERRSFAASWLPPKNLHNGPEESMLYSLLKGKSELVMFGGIHKDGCQLEAVNLNMSKNLSSQISNSLHFITAPNYII